MMNDQQQQEPKALIPAGTHRAAVTDWAITATKSNDPQVAVVFEVLVNDECRRITWYGSFKEKARPITLKALLVCGFKPNGDLNAIADGIPGGALSAGKEVDIVISHELDQQGTKRARVQWVNQIGGAGFKEKLEKGQFQLPDMRGDLMAAALDMGIKPTNTGRPPVGQQRQGAPANGRPPQQPQQQQQNDPYGDIKW
jgi:hypothetical protein